MELLGISYDKTQTLRKGAVRAPDVIRKVFPKLETYVSGVDLSKVFINDLGNIYPQDVEELMEKTKILRDTEFPLIIGGDHSISFPCVKHLERIRSFVCLDAHPDCCPKSGLSHDNVTRKIAAEIGAENVFLYGIRCYSLEEKKFLDTVKINLVKNINEVRKAEAPVYLSIDFDVLDPSVMPAVGNPEPSGLSFSEVLEVVRLLSGKIAAIDFVEFTPVVSGVNEVYALIAGKLIYAAMSEIVKRREEI